MQPGFPLGKMPETEQSYYKCMIVWVFQAKLPSIQLLPFRDLVVLLLLIQVGKSKHPSAQWPCPAHTGQFQSSQWNVPGRPLEGSVQDQSWSDTQIYLHKLSFLWCVGRQTASVKGQVQPPLECSSFQSLVWDFSFPVIIHVIVSEVWNDDRLVVLLFAVPLSWPQQSGLCCCWRDHH